MNLVVIVDRGFRGEVENRLARVGRYHPSRLVIAAVEAGRTQLDAWATVAAEDAVHKPGPHRGRARAGRGRHRPAARSRASTRSSTRCWSPTSRRWCGRRTATQRGRRRAAPAGQHRARRHAGRARGRARRSSAPPTSPRSAYVVDLAWLRSTPWRERVAASFDPPAMRARAAARSTKVDGAPPARLDRGRRAVLRLARVAPGLAAGGARAARRPASPATAARAAARSRSSCEPQEMGAPGLGGVTIEMASGESVSLDRGPGGLRAVRRDARRRASRPGR